MAKAKVKQAAVVQKTHTAGTSTKVPANTTERTKDPNYKQPPVRVGHLLVAPYKAARARRRLAAGITNNEFIMSDEFKRDCIRAGIPIPTRANYERTYEYLEDRKQKAAQSAARTESEPVTIGSVTRLIARVIGVA